MCKRLCCLVGVGASVLQCFGVIVVSFRWYEVGGCVGW